MHIIFTCAYSCTIATSVYPKMNNHLVKRIMCIFNPDNNLDNQYNSVDIYLLSFMFCKCTVKCSLMFI